MIFTRRTMPDARYPVPPERKRSARVEHGLPIGKGNAMAVMRIACLMAFAAFFTAAWGADIYKWVDEKGRTQYGQSVPDKYKKSAIKIEQEIHTPTDAQREEAAARAAQDKEKAAALATRKLEPAKPRTSVKPAPASAAVENKATRCEAERQKYRESVACFEPYRMPNGAIQPEGLEKCVSMKEPTC